MLELVAYSIGRHCMVMDHHRYLVYPNHPLLVVAALPRRNQKRISQRSIEIQNVKISMLPFLTLESSTVSLYLSLGDITRIFHLTKITNENNTFYSQSYPGYDEYDRSMLISQTSFEKTFGLSTVFIESTLMENGGVPDSANSPTLIKEAIHVISCGYEEKTAWGKEVEKLVATFYINLELYAVVN